MLAFVALGAMLGSACFGSSGGGGSPGAPTGTAIGAVSPSSAGDLLMRFERRIVVQPRGGAPRELLRSDEAGVYLASPVWSPDGTQVAYIRQLLFSGRPGADWGDDIYVVPSAGGMPRVVHTHSVAGQQVQGLAWTRDGGLIFGDYAPVLAAGQIVDYTVRLARIDLATRAVTTMLEDAHDATLSRDGTRMSYITSDGLFVAGPRGEDAKLLVRAGTYFALMFPHIAPDGASVAFAATERAPTVAGPRRGGVRGLLARTVSALWAAVAPRTAEAHGAPMDVMRIDVASGTITQLTHLAEDDPQPAWSADGRTLVVMATAGLYEVAADGSRVVKLGPGVFGGQVDVR